MNMGTLLFVESADKRKEKKTILKDWIILFLVRHMGVLIITTIELLCSKRHFTCLTKAGLMSILKSLVTIVFKVP